VSWVGSGSGSTSLLQDQTPNPVISPTGPVTEAATFRPNPLPTWNLTVVPEGLPTAAPYLVTFGSSTYAATGTFRISGLLTGNYSVAVPFTYLNGSGTTRFVADSVTSDLPFAANGWLEVTGNGTLTIEYTTQYLLLLSATPTDGGTIVPGPGSYWENASGTVSLTATPASGYGFVGWNSSGGGLVATPTAVVSMTGPLGLTAQFAPLPAAVPGVFWAAITESGIPVGVAWNFSLGSYGTSGSNATLVVNGLNGSYPLTVATVVVGPGARYVPSVTGVLESVRANWSLSVTFTEQFLVTVTAGLGGTVTPATPTWVNAGSTIEISAAPNGSSMHFANWTGTGSGSYSGTEASRNLTVTAPMIEQAAFAPVYSEQTVTQGANGNGLAVAVGLLIGLLAVGLVAGVLLGRRRGAPPTPPGEPDEATASETGTEPTPETPGDPGESR